MRTFKGEFLKSFILPCGRDITGYTDLRVFFIKPDGSKGNWTTVTQYSGDVTKAQLDLADATELQQLGVWSLLPRFTIGGKIGYADTKTYLRVLDNNELHIEDPEAESGIIIWGNEAEAWINVQGDTVTITKENKPYSQDKLTVFLGGNATPFDDDAGPGVISQHLDGNDIVFSEDITGFNVMAMWFYQLTILS